MMQGHDSEEVEIDLLDSDDSTDEGSFEERGEPLWKAPAVLEDEDSIDTCDLVEISDTRPLIVARDPRGINECLQVTFEDVIAEPVSLRSTDKVWFWSNALFEVCRVWIYRVLSLLLAVPMAVLSGLLFAVLSCFHIWMVQPCMRCTLIGTYWLQSLWAVVLEVVVGPLFTSAGRSCGGFSVHLAEE
ncbi:hypothetical protein NHX12_029814 [Muraenolepis orangiensis]|uniref:Caveolin n=1 Tax=Muraenolepis orangiensis TaxID=630683 RepID=A0A9Q0E8N2_9TELE|nr:hypothetical protein NHX12_029814 [Muraenolepis orangiensis]